MCIFFFFHWLSWPASISAATCGARGLTFDCQIIKTVVVVVVVVVKLNIAWCHFGHALGILREVVKGYTTSLFKFRSLS